ncbi:hypothetical protein GOP47_0005786 [Adiantum capillus-veneris]|uniref:C3H1-type domain-containing protein n=1 Tax=Adiantum capillus-veneris TaxID=13818 RepID=A0A9D4V7D6_ADICA|nr:hypothetical protein GOP47_0005786 [Adiantum capillus-veneris]
MKGFQVEKPALHSSLSSLHSVFKPVGHEHAIFSPHPKQEAEFEGKLQPLQIPSSLQSNSIKTSTPVGGRGLQSWPECIYGGLFHPSSESNTLGLHELQNMVVPAAEKKQNLEEYVRRGKPHMGIFDGDIAQGEEEVACMPRGMSKVSYVEGSNGYVDSEEGHHICNVQASMASPTNGIKVDRMVRFNGLVNNDSEFLNSFQDFTAMPTKGNSHLGRFTEHMGKRGNHINNFQASMAAQTCESPKGDSPFWRFLPSNNEKHSMDLTSCDEFCMYQFKVRRCMHGRSHDWTECPFAHPGEKARRRDPRCFNYSGTACPDFRRGICRKGDSCELSHGVFECWLHPARYRTQLCKDGKDCKRRVCFFAHSPSQLRHVSPDPLLNNDLCSMNMPLASSTDAMTGYFEGPLKQSPLFTKNSYGANGLFNDLSPRSMPRFPIEGHQNAMSHMSALRHSLEHLNRGPLETDLEHYTDYNSYGHQGMALEDLSTKFELNSDQDHSHGYCPVTCSLLVADNHGYEGSQSHSYCHTNSPHSSPLEKESVKADTNFRSQLAIANLKGSLDQLMSPTSTLVGHVFSPPPLSPPLSPAESPPMSPNMTLSSWSTALSRKVASLAAGHPLPYEGFAHSPTSGVDSTHVSVPTYVPKSNYGSLVHTITHGPSPLSATANGDQLMHDIDKLNAMQSSRGMKNDCVETLSNMETNPPADAMVHLISMLQQMELRRAAMADMKNRKRCPSLLQRMQSPKARLEAGHGESWGRHGLMSPQRHESGQGLRGKINGSLAKEEMENPDLGWVNELVK